jgi:hypothetical protein
MAIIEFQAFQTSFRVKHCRYCSFGVREVKLLRWRSSGPAAAGPDA